MEKAKWKQVDAIKNEDLKNIPQKHFDDFVKNLSVINNAWLCIDPSKRSNFFMMKIYDLYLLIYNNEIMIIKI